MRADVGLSRDPEREISEHEKRVVDWVIGLGHPLRSRVRVEVMTPRTSALEGLSAAARGARCVIIGRPQDSRLERLPTELAGRCFCPVLVLDPDNLGEPVPV